MAELSYLLLMNKSLSISFLKHQNITVTLKIGKAYIKPMVGCFKVRWYGVSKTSPREKIGLFIFFPYNVKGVYVV